MGILEVRDRFAAQLADRAFEAAERTPGLIIWRRTRPDDLIDVVWLQTSPPSDELVHRAASEPGLAPPRLTFELQAVRPDGRSLTEPYAAEVAPRTRIGLLLEPPLDWWWASRRLLESETVVVGDDDTLVDHLTSTFLGAAEPWFARQPAQEEA